MSRVAGPSTLGLDPRDKRKGSEDGKQEYLALQANAGALVVGTVEEAPCGPETRKPLQVGMLEKKVETTIMLGVCWGYIGIMEKKMETTIMLGVCWGYIGIMELEVETTIMLGVC